MRTYELAVLLHPDLEIDLEKPLAKLEGLIKAAEAEILQMDNWGKRRLAYPINKQEFAVYVFYRLKIPAGSVAGLEKSLLIADEVIRHLLVVFDEKLQQATEAKPSEGEAPDDQKAAPKARKLDRPKAEA